MKSITVNIFTVAIICVVTFFTFKNVLVAGDTESSGEILLEELGNAIEIYKNFSDAVFGALSDIGENTTESEPDTVDDGGSVASLLGISYILASTSEHVWPLSFPVFDGIMGNLSWNVLEAFDTVLLQMKETLNFVTVMFVPLNHNSTSKNKNLIEFIAVDFEEDDATVPVINEKIFNSTNRLIQTNYIQDGVLIPSSAQAIFVNTVFTNLTWKAPWTPIGKTTFNKNEQGEMLEFQGEIRMIERNSSIEVLIFFQNNQSGLALRMPKDISDRSVANIEEMMMSTSTNATIQVPWMNYTVRSKYNLNDENISSCEFQKEENVLQILDVLTYIFLGPYYFTTVSVSGAQVINVQQFQEEIRQQPDLYNGTIQENISPSEADMKTNTYNPLTTKLADQDENMEETDFDYLETDDNDSSPIKEYGSPDRSNKDDNEKPDPLIEDEPGTPSTSQQSDKHEKLIIFNRPFTWMLFDEHRVPIVAGIFTSLLSPEEDAPPNFSFLGMESWKTAPYFQCF